MSGGYIITIKDMSTSDKCKICKDVVSKSNDGLCELEGKLQNMSTADNGDISVCANCGKEGNDVNNICNKCKKATYCNAACKKKHRHKHNKDCEEHIKLAAERAAELHDIELFKQPPPKEEDCPICFLLLPSLVSGSKYQSCCGKMICSGCLHAPLYDNQGNEVDNKKCPFCRTPDPDTDEEIVEREKKRLEVDDAVAIYNLGNYYDKGMYGYPQNHIKALELWHRAGELGFIRAYTNIGYAYNHGEGVEVDEKKAVHYYELAAIRGDVQARYNLGAVEIRAGNCDRALNHHMIAVGSGHNESLKEIKRLYSYERATKEDYMKALQSYQTYLGEIKNKQRDEAAAFDSEEYRYY